MLFKRFVQAATAALVLIAAAPGSAQQVLKVGSTPTGVPFTFLDTKSNQIQGVMVDIITEIRAASEASAGSIRGLRTVGSIPRERRGVAPHQCREANDLRPRL